MHIVIEAQAGERVALPLPSEEKNLALKNITHEFTIVDIDTKKFIDPEKRQQVYLIFKEAVTSA